LIVKERTAVQGNEPPPVAIVFSAGETHETHTFAMCGKTRRGKSANENGSLSILAPGTSTLESDPWELSDD